MVCQDTGVRLWLPPLVRFPRSLSLGPTRGRAVGVLARDPVPRPGLPDPLPAVVLYDGSLAPALMKLGSVVPTRRVKCLGNLVPSTERDETMSAGPLTTYNGTVGVADNGGDSLTEDLNIYYAVSFPPQLPPSRLPLSAASPPASPSPSARPGGRSRQGEKEEEEEREKERKRARPLTRSF